MARVVWSTELKRKRERVRTKALGIFPSNKLNNGCGLFFYLFLFKKSRIEIK